jgi:uncharacterized membrane protein SpoIIM required for sporulation
VEKKDIIKTILSADGFRLREYILIIVSIIMILSMFITLYNVESYKQECINHYKSQMERAGYYNINTFNSNFTFKLNLFENETFK